MALDPIQRIVNQTPLTRIWNEGGELDAERIQDVGLAAIKSVLSQGSVQFVVAKFGSPLKWIHPDLTLDFWKQIAKQRIVSPDADGFTLDDYPDGYCYCAALWKIQDSNDVIDLENIIVLEAHH